METGRTKGTTLISWFLPSGDFNCLLTWQWWLFRYYWIVSVYLWEFHWTAPQEFLLDSNLGVGKCQGNHAHCDHEVVKASLSHGQTKLEFEVLRKHTGQLMLHALYTPKSAKVIRGYFKPVAIFSHKLQITVLRQSDQDMSVSSRNMYVSRTRLPRGSATEWMKLFS
jgi:hypothetical protein